MLTAQTLRKLSLFSGIGGFDLAARWAGFTTIGFCEKEPFCQKVLTKHWPGVPIYDDICTFDARFLRGTVDLLTGGFPCQPYSIAGKKQGRADDRALWPEMLRVITECQPTWVVGENVAQFIHMDFSLCCADMETAGYEVQAFVLPACAVNAPHRRDRVWIVGYSERSGLHRDTRRRAGPQLANGHVPSATGEPTCHYAPAPHSAERQEQQLTESARTQLASFRRADWRQVKPLLRAGDDGVPNRLARPHGWRNAALKATGNAIVPQIAYPILQAIRDTYPY